MTEVHFNGQGEWLIKDINGEVSRVIREFDDFGDPKFKLKKLNDEILGEIEFGRYRHFDGVFKLTGDDEKKYVEYKDFDLVKKSVFKLEPSSHPFSVFLRMVKEGWFKEEDAERCYFIINKLQRGKKKLKEVNFDLIPITSETQAKAESTKYNPNKSNQLAMLNQASEIFWGNADRSDKTTWTATKVIVSWFQKHEFSESLAKKAASIIRPEWAGSGRPPSE